MYATAAGSIGALLFVSLTAEVVGVTRNVTWTVSGVRPYRNYSTPLLINIGDTLLLGCVATSYSTVVLQYTVQQYDACDANVGGGSYLLSYCIGQAEDKVINIIEPSSSVANVVSFRPGGYYYLASFGNNISLDISALSGGECLLGLKMIIHIPCGNNCSQCDSTRSPSRCLSCNPGFCLDNTTATCLPTTMANCLVCNSTGCLQCSTGYCLSTSAMSCVLSTTSGACTTPVCEAGYVPQDGVCIINPGGDTSTNVLSEQNIIAIAAGGGGGVLVILMLLCGFVLCYCCCCKAKGKVSVSCTPEGSLSGLITKQSRAEISTMCSNETLSRQYFATLGVEDNLPGTMEDRCCCEKCFGADTNKDNKGWMLFGVSKTDATWDVAYWGVPSPDQLKEIISKGLKPATGSTNTRIMVTPSMRYCLHKDTFSKKQQYQDPHTFQAYSVRVVLKVRVKPSSYTRGPQTVGEKHRIDPQYENEQLEWLIEKSPGNIAIESVMIKISPSRKSEPVTPL